ncbi:MAG TPA: DNA-processing protein DprA [Actinocrinis sp.]|nr:DNA-processing protein DprA [Actinocrinis sp.]
MSVHQDLAPPRDAPPESAIEADRTARLALNHAVEPADPQIGRLLELHSPIEVLAAIRTDQLPDLDPDPARHDRLADRCTGLRLRLEPGRVEAGIAAADAVCARFITPSDIDWPVRLDDLGQQRPIGIWAIGSWGDLPGGPLNVAADEVSEEDDSSPTGSEASSLAPSTEMLSIVGARACTGYGSYMAGALGADLASAGMAVVSGAALGIDAAAHRGALAVGGPTIAVLACGIDRAYPRSHEALLRAIAERGAVLSELPPGASPTRFRFLHRNRIIAALGVGTVVVEAAHRSGSLVTARLAAELGRVVMAVPGPVTSDQSAGAHELIRDGATLVVGASQVREACATLTAASHEPRGAIAANASSIRRGRVERRTARAQPARPAEPVDPVEELLLEALPSATADVGAGVGVDVFALARATGVGPDAVFAALGRLAACGRAVRAGGGWLLSPAAKH